jgi:uncharacterized membrane protein YdbT with pleckstrin-like domain
MDDLKGFREGIHGLGHYIKENDNLIEKQVRYLNAYIQTAGQATDSMGKHFDKVDDAITRFVEKRIQTLMEDSRKAAVQVEEYFAHLREDNIHMALARQIDSLKKEIEQLNNGRENYRLATHLVNQSAVPKAEPAQTIIREVLPADILKNEFINTTAFKFFVYISIIFYATALAAFIGFLLARFMNT